MTLKFRFDNSKLDTAKVLKVIAGIDNKGLIGVRLTDDETIKQLNHRYAGINKPTDVLSFPYVNTESLGDIVVSLPQLEKQARAAGTDAETEFALLVLHGVLHILGYDHQNAGERQKMDELQAKYMNSAGLAYRNFGWKE